MLLVPMPSSDVPPIDGLLIIDRAEDADVADVVVAPIAEEAILTEGGRPAASSRDRGLENEGRFEFRLLSFKPPPGAHAQFQSRHE